MTAVERTLIVVSLPDLAAADAAFERAVARAPGADLDAVTLGRNRAGVVRFDREPPHGEHAKCSIAAGVAAALYPSVAADLPGDRVADRAVLAAVAGRIAFVLGRRTMYELGEHLDATSASLVAVAPPDLQTEIVSAVVQVVDVELRLRVQSIVLDVDAVERQAGAARRAGRSRPRDR